MAAMPARFPFLAGRAAAATEGKRKVLVAIFLRGAARWLKRGGALREKRYYELRPTIGIPAPGPQNSAIDLDGHFGLNPALQPLKPLWDKQQLAIVEATGSPDPSRSHFDAQDYMESGTPGVKGDADGWLNRALTPPGPDASPLRAIAMGAQLPRTLRGNRAAIAVSDVQQFKAGSEETASILEKMYGGTTDTQIGAAGKEAFAAVKSIQLNRGNYIPANGANYNQAGELGRNLQQVARLIKADVGVEAAFAEINGWDHHGNEPVLMSNVLRQFGSALAGFSQDMGDRMEDIVVVTMSEFGRTAEENGNQGTDHGHGDLMMVLGGPVQGGKIYGKWPGLEKEQLYEGRDLAVTTDFRDVLGELVRGHLGQQNLAQVFPGYQPGEPLGLLRSPV